MRNLNAVSSKLRFPFIVDQDVNLIFNCILYSILRVSLTILFMNLLPQRQFDYWLFFFLQMT